MTKIPKQNQKNTARKMMSTSLNDVGFPKDYSLVRIGTSQSLLSYFPQCRIAYLLKLNHYMPSGAKNNTGYGSMNHDILDKMYSYGKEHRRVPTDKMIDSWLEKFRSEQIELLEGMSEQEIEYAVGVSYVMLTEYTKFYSEDFTVMEFDEIEKVSASRLGPYLLRRKTDGKFYIHGGKWLLEHKTMGTIAEKSLLLKLGFDFQNLFYITCEEIDHPEDPVEGVLYNVMRRPNHMQGDDESLKDFLIRLRKEVQKNPPYFFMRWEIRYLPEDKKAYKEELLNILNEANKCIESKAPIYRNCQACTGFWSCEYLGACASNSLSGYIKSKYYFPELNLGF